MKPHLTYKNGFTMIEMSIVLILIGVIVASVLSAGVIQDNAEQKRLISELSFYDNAIKSFYNQFNGWPGDIRRADEVWGANCGGDSAASGGGCNGDGDRLIEWSAAEGVKGWQHLELAELIEPNNYSGTMTSGTATIGTNIPASRLDNIGYSLYNAGTSNFLSVGGPVSSNRNTGPFMAPVAAESIDVKLDDGAPTTGTVRAIGTNCISGTEFIYLEESGHWDTTVDDNVCSLDYLITK